MPQHSFKAEVDVPSVSYTPVLTAATTNPTLGSGSSQLGRYIKLGGLVVYWFQIQFGTSGTAPGSGDYRVSLPVTPIGSMGSFNGLGNVQMLDSPSTRHYGTIMPWSFSGSGYFTMLMLVGGFVDHDTPFGWAASDVLGGVVHYACEP